jgi:hypothetical protein
MGAMDRSSFCFAFIDKAALPQNRIPHQIQKTGRSQSAAAVKIRL